MKHIFKIRALEFALLKRFGEYTVALFWRDKLIFWRQCHPGMWRDSKRHQLSFYVRCLQVWPVYWSVFRRDCDLCERTYAVRTWCFLAGYLMLRSAQEDWTEGPFHFYQISRREFKNFSPWWRDRIGEAFDNGDGTKVIL